MVDEELQKLARFYEGDLPEFGQLKWERQAWFHRCNEEGLETSYQCIQEKFHTEPAMKVMFPGLHTALVLFIVLPATTCQAERSFSMLRRLLTYLRSTQGQERMSSLALLNSHRDIVRTVLPIDDLMQEFTRRSTVRLNMFEKGEATIKY